MIYLSPWRLLFVFAVLLACCGFWAAATAKEHARRHAKNVCQREGVQLLDDTVVRTSFRVKKGKIGFLVFCWQFRFEFSSLGDKRYSGTLVLEGNKLASVEMQAYKVAEETAELPH